LQAFLRLAKIEEKYRCHHQRDHQPGPAACAKGHPPALWFEWEQSCLTMAIAFVHLHASSACARSHKSSIKLPEQTR
jgi:hypothetical protein